jgi:ADP-ribosylglycohydrolase
MLDRYKGCLQGLAVGDALGAPGEFLDVDEIRAAYGDAGITDFFGWQGFKAGTYTDDTQLSLATAVGCLLAGAQFSGGGDFDAAGAIHKQYLKWLDSQNDPMRRRAPGITCVGALRSGKLGTIENPINDSKGCGGVMRPAPVGLAFDGVRAFRLGAEFAAITHGHPSGYLPAGFLAQLISHLRGGESLSPAIAKSRKTLVGYKGHEETLKAVELALRLAKSQTPIDAAISRLGQGWVGEEALGISLYCSLKFSADFKAGAVAAVNHSGDSDSTGSITGAILGTLLGVAAIPAEWIRKLENSSLISEVAEDLYRVFRKGEDLSQKNYPTF